MKRIAKLVVIALASGLFAIPSLRGAGPEDADVHAVQRMLAVALGPAPPPAPAAFPLRVSADGRYLEDDAGEPFLMNGDTAWSLIAQLKRDDVDVYLRDRRARGFNTILVNLIEHQFASNAPANAYGDKPFLSPGAFDQPNEAYFAYADWVIERALQEGFLVLLAPCYTGAGGGPEGWYQSMVKAGTAKLRDYGRYVGRRYSRFPNILWVQNGDTNPVDPKLVQAVAEAIHETDPGALQTAHNNNGTPGASLWVGAPWLTVNNIYTWGPVFPDARSQYQRKPPLPFFLIESQYENGTDITPQRVRRQAYQALLTGAAGQVFGNSPIWYFDGATFPSTPRGWKAALDSNGSRSMTSLHSLFARLEWEDLEPDIHNDFLVRGQGDGHQRAVAALSRDRQTAIVYIPEDRAITLDMSRLGGARMEAVWWDPTDGAAFEAAGGPLKQQGNQTFKPSVANAAGDGDWILLLRGQE